MRLVLALEELSAALPLSSLAFSASCAISCFKGKGSCNATRASAIINPRPNDRSMRRFIYESEDFDQRPGLVLGRRFAQEIGDLTTKGTKAEHKRHKKSRKISTCKWIRHPIL